MQPITWQKIKQAFLIIALLLSVVAIAYTVSQPKVAPAADFTTIKGEQISMRELKGKVVLINFWATSCRSCIEEMPNLINTYQQYQNKGFEIIAVAMPYDPPAQVVAFTKQKKLPFPVMHDSYGNITRQFGGVNVTPTAYIYDKTGKRIQNTVGTLNFEQLHTLLNQELS